MSGRKSGVGVRVRVGRGVGVSVTGNQSTVAVAVGIGVGDRVGRGVGGWMSQDTSRRCTKNNSGNQRVMRMRPVYQVRVGSRSFFGFLCYTWGLILGDLKNQSVSYPKTQEGLTVCSTSWAD